MRFAASVGCLLLSLVSCSCAGSATSPGIAMPGAVIRPASCPPAAPRSAPSPARSELSANVVPPTPVFGTVCRYAGLTPTGQSGTLIRSHVLSHHALATVVALLNSPKNALIAHPETYRCPSDDGAADVVIFDYEAGPPVRVAVDLGGCRFASNGVRTIGGFYVGQLLRTWVGG